MKAHELLGQGRYRWIKGGYARDKRGFPVNSDDPGAYCFCAVGAVNHCYGLRSKDRDEAMAKLNDYVAGCTDFSSIPGWNDSDETRYEDVVGVLRRLDV